MKAAVLKLKMLPPPLEKHDQENYFAWLVYQKYQGRRIWDFAYAVPNGSYRGSDRPKAANVADALTRQGMKRGYPDVNVDIPVAPYHGLRIEFKRIGAPKSNAEQIAWHDRLRAQGYFVAVCYGFEEARTITIAYFRLQGAPP